MNRWVRISILAAFVVAPLASPAQESGAPFARFRANDRDAQSIGPGKVRLHLRRDGRWTGLSPAWNKDKTMFTAGGVLLFVRDGDGYREMVSAARSQIQVDELSRRVPKLYEGVRGGFRAPAPNPDDDRDGRENEDRVDGVDNDKDGAIDEDFAGIGDEMIVTGYSLENSQTGQRFAFHEEAYAWSLPNIDGAIMLSIWVKNTGDVPVEGVRLGTFFERDEPAVFSRREFRENGRTGAGVVCRDDDGSALAVIGLPSISGDRWAAGYSAATEDLGVLVSKRLRGLSETSEPRQFFGLFNRASTEGRPVRRTDRTVAYAVSPEWPTLRPGEEMRANFAIMAVEAAAQLGDIARNTIKTYIGDGAHHFLPPAVSITPRVLWGYYRPLVDGEPKVLIDIEDLSDDPITRARVSYFSGIDAGSIEEGQSRPGMLQLVLRGGGAERLLDENDRVTLKGRLDNGEFFEAILRPGSAPAGAAAEASDVFWRTPGRLRQEVLKASPNPFRDATTVFYEIPSLIEQEDGTSIETSGTLQTGIKVYDVTGRLVRVLVDNAESTGMHTTQWSAVDDQGNPVASGVYYIKLQIEKRFITKRLILLK